MKIKDITSYIESIAPLKFQESYDNAGLITGNPDWKCKGALITLDSIEATIDEAIRKKCNLVIAHHPIVFKGLKRLNGKNYVERTIIKAIKNDIAIYAAHTNLDNVHNGVNKKICDKLGVINTQILAPKKELLKKIFTFCPSSHADKVRQAMFDSGAGNISNYDNCSFNSDGNGTFRGGQDTKPFIGKKGELHTEPEVKIEMLFPAYLENKLISHLISAHPYEEVAYDIVNLTNIHPQVGSGMVGELKKEMDPLKFLKKIKKTMKAGVVRYTELPNEPIKRVAVCGGSGSFLLQAAKAAKADIFITADYKYHEFFDADNQIVIADIGHYESEQFTNELFMDIISEKFPNFAVILSDLNTNPVNYL